MSVNYSYAVMSGIEKNISGAEAIYQLEQYIKADYENLISDPKDYLQDTFTDLENYEDAAAALIAGKLVPKGAGKGPESKKVAKPKKTVREDAEKYINNATAQGLKKSQAKVSETVLKNTPTSKPLQNSSNLHDLYSQAQVADQELKSITNEIASSTNGVAGFRDGLKSKARALEKVNADYEGDASQLLDISGSKIVYNSLDELYSGLEKASKELDIIRIKDRFVNPVGGYRDVLMNVKMSNGHVVEFRLHLKQIDEVAEGSGHELYEQIRSLDAISKTRDLSPSELSTISNLERQMESEYQTVWNQVIKSNK